MKKINKQESPQWFEDWKKDYKAANNRDAHYKNDFSTDDADGRNRRRRLRKNLVDLLASCNGEGTVVVEDEHCGHRKDNWWRADMISPTDVEIEKVFKYLPNGKINSIRGRTTSNIAQEMIHNLGLDSFHLERDRRQAIEASEVFDDEEYSEGEIRSFIEYYSNKDNGVYVPFCKAIIDCLEEML